jgi:hypothetical protein
MTAPACLALEIESLICLRLESNSIAHWLRLQVATVKSLIVWLWTWIRELQECGKLQGCLFFVCFDSTKLWWKLKFNSVTPGSLDGLYCWLKTEPNCSKINWTVYVNYEPNLINRTRTREQITEPDCFDQINSLLCCAYTFVLLPQLRNIGLVKLNGCGNLNHDDGSARWRQLQWWRR